MNEEDEEEKEEKEGGGGGLTPCLVEIFFSTETNPARGTRLKQFHMVRVAINTKPVLEVLP